MNNRGLGHTLASYYNRWKYHLKYSLCYFEDKRSAVDINCVTCKYCILQTMHLRVMRKYEKCKQDMTK